MTQPIREWYTGPTDVNVVAERSTPVLTAIVKDEKGNFIPGSSLFAMVLSLYAKSSGTVINARSAQNVLQANNVTIDESGVLTFSMQEADNLIVDATLQAGSREVHAALFTYQWVYGAYTKTGRHLIEFYVENLLKVP